MRSTSIRESRKTKSVHYLSWNCVGHTQNAHRIEIRLPENKLERIRDEVARYLQ